MQPIYVDHAATTPLDIQAFNSMKEFMLKEYGNPGLNYEISAKGKRALIQARAGIAELIGASFSKYAPREIIFTSGGTEGNNWILQKGRRSTKAGRIRKGIITSCIEHPSVLEMCKRLEEQGEPVFYVPVDNQGIVQPEVFEREVKAALKQTPLRLASIMMVNHEVGTIQPIKELAKIAHDHGLLFHTDAVAAMGHINVDVLKLDVDYLTASAHKFNGPKGVGFIYQKSLCHLEPLFYGGQQELGQRAGMVDIPAVIAMHTALKNHMDYIDSQAEELDSLERLFLKELHKHTDLKYRLNVDREHRLPGFLSLAFYNLDGDYLLENLRKQKIFASQGTACVRHNYVESISPILKAMHVEDDWGFGTIRMTFGVENLPKEMVLLAQTIKDSIAKCVELQEKGITRRRIFRRKLIRPTKLLPGWSRAYL